MRGLLRLFMYGVACFTISVNVCGRMVIPGNATTPNATFAVPVNSFLGEPDGLMIAAAANGGAQTFAIAEFDRATVAFKGITLETVSLNGTANTANPLYNVAIKYVVPLQQNYNPAAPLSPVLAVPSANPATAYWIENSATLLSCTTINDAQGNSSAGIISLAGSVISCAFAAVLPNTGSFGDPGSGITRLCIMQNTVTENKTERTVLALTAPAQAASLTTSTPGVFIGSPLSLLSSPISLSWDVAWATRNLPLTITPEPVYCGIGSVVSNTDPTDGACSMLIGTNGSSFLLAPIFASTANFSGAGTNKIIIATGASVELSVHQVRTMWTSTNLRYLIVVGGNGDPTTTANTAYAMPLVAVGAFEGLLASSSNIAVPALGANDLCTNTDLAAFIGGGPLNAGTITQLSVHNDLVYVVVSQGPNQGVYASQALFNSDGTIAQWTTWHRIISNPPSPFNAALSLANGTWAVLTSSDPSGSNQPDTVTLTQWGNGDPTSFGPAIAQLDPLFEQNGVENMTNFNANIPGLSTTALLAIYGGSTLALVETGQLNGDGVYTLTNPTSFENSMVYSNGNVTVTPTDQTILAWSGGSLATAGPLVSVAIGNSTAQNDSWLFAAGLHGLTVLANPTNGTGWGNALGANFAGIVAGMQFVPIGNYTFIKKITADGNFLYVLTDTQFDRIDLDSNILDPTITTIAYVTEMAGLSSYDCFTDCIVSSTLACIGTSQYMYRIADGNSVTDPAPSWVAMPLPEQEFPIVQLVAVTASGTETDCAKTGGNLYITSGNETDVRTVVNRVAVNPLQGQPVSDTTLQIFTADFYVPNVPSYCIDYGRAVHAFSLDGALTYAVNNNTAPMSSALLLPLFNHPLRSNMRFTGPQAQPIGAATVGNILASSLLQQNASGAWMLGYNKGVRINE
jgi:hypothetical protein